MTKVSFLGVSLHRDAEPNDKSKAWGVCVTYRIKDHSVKAPCGWPDNNEKQIFRHGMSRRKAFKMAERLASIIDEGKRWFDAIND